MVRGFFVSVWLLALTAPFVGASAADATRDASSAMPQDGVTITTVNYTIPPVHLVRETGQSVLLTQEMRSEEHTSELQSLAYLVCRLLLEKKKINKITLRTRTHRYRRLLVPLERSH